MSRNIRRKTAAPVQKARKRRGSDTSSSSLDLSGEEGYSGVDEISDDEDDQEDDVDAAEEENIVTRGGLSSPAAPRPHLAFENDDEEDPDGDQDEEDDNEDDGYHYNYDDDDHDNDDASPAHDDGDSTSWAGIQSEKDDSPSDQFDDHFRDADYGVSTKVDRHVRFDLPDRVNTDDDLSTDDDYAGMYTDIFIEQKHLDPAFRREMEHDPDESSGSGSFWDFTGDQTDFDTETVKNDYDDDSTHATPTATSYQGVFLNSELQPDPFAKIEDLSPPSELDGYETDGETTDEDVPEPIIRRKSRRPSPSISEVTDSEVDTSTRNERGQPRVGRFRLDKCHKKPTVVLNPVTRKLMILTPHNRRQLDLSPEHFHDLPMFPLDEPTSPMLSNSANMMISAMSMFSANAFAEFVNGQAVAEPEAFFADLNNVEDSEGSLESHLFFDGEDDQDDGERNLDLSDFIAFGDDSSEDEDEKEKGKDWEPSSTPARPTTASSDVDILSHLNSHTVGAFRRNQVNQQLILSNQATQDSLAFSGPYNHTAIRGLRSDRFDTAGAPLTPARRRKNRLGDMGRSPLEAMSSKRKASGEAQNGGHKKQRSISDVNNLHI